MKFINDDFGLIFESEEEAREDMAKRMELSDYAIYLALRINYDELLQWALNQPNFSKEHEEIFAKAKEDFFSDYYKEYEDEEEEEDF